VTEEKEKEINKNEKKKKSHASNVRKKDTIPMNVLKNCPRQQRRRVLAY